MGAIYGVMSFQTGSRSTPPPTAYVWSGETLLHLSCHLQMVTSPLLCGLRPIYPQPLFIALTPEDTCHSEWSATYDSIGVRPTGLRGGDIPCPVLCRTQHSHNSLQRNSVLPFSSTSTSVRSEVLRATKPAFSHHLCRCLKKWASSVMWGELSIYCFIYGFWRLSQN